MRECTNVFNLAFKNKNTQIAVAFSVSSLGRAARTWRRGSSREIVGADLAIEHSEQLEMTEERALSRDLLLALKHEVLSEEQNRRGLHGFS